MKFFDKNDILELPDIEMIGISGAGMWRNLFLWGLIG